MNQKSSEEVAKDIQNITDNIILNYLLARQNILLEKFNALSEGSKRSFDHFGDSIQSLESNVKGLIETQIN